MYLLSRVAQEFVTLRATTNALWVNGLNKLNKSVNFTYSNNLAQPWYVGGARGTILSVYPDAGSHERGSFLMKL
jgi:hypothetical protein